MSDLVRFGVAMERGLLEQFDQRIARRGYENRSEALRDLVRADLTRAAWHTGARVLATLHVVYMKKSREAYQRVLDAERAWVHVDTLLTSKVDETRAIDVFLVRGTSEELGRLAGKIAGIRGVLSSELSIACPTNETPSEDAGGGKLDP